MTGRTLYTLALRLATPIILARLLWRSRRARAYRRRWGERFGFVPRCDRAPIWIHAVSVGETIAAAALVRALLQQHPEQPILLTNITPTGSERARALFGDDVLHCHLPYDLPGAVRRFLDRTRPRIGIIMETEIWPNLLAECAGRGIPVLLANARLSERSRRGYARVPRLTGEALSRIDWIGAQGEADAARFRHLGAPADRLEITGNLKFDQTIPEDQRRAGTALRERLGSTRPVWIAASTHAGEDEIVLDAHRLVRERQPDAGLILVPRHPERFDDVARLVEGAGFTLTRRSADAGSNTVADAVYLGDTMGELPALLAAADIAFIGGSLVATGGHNLLEPAALARPVLSGPHTFNFREIDRLLTEAGGLVRVTDAGTLAEVVADLVREPARRTDIGERAAGVVEANRGALKRILEAVQRRL